MSEPGEQEFGQLHPLAKRFTAYSLNSVTSARAQALIALWTYWQLAGLGSMALAPSALSVLWRLALIASVDSLALAQAKWLLLLSGLSGIDVALTAFGTYCLEGLTGSLLVAWVLALAFQRWL
ncbi:hypothetical protein LXG23DRAFT_54481 [Yarrowia lipolytica]|nr:hypothetical protein LXG23DRAFT_54481 [Yarrowia lipolytica]